MSPTPTLSGYRRLHVIVGDSNMSEYAHILENRSDQHPAADVGRPIGGVERHDPGQPDPGYPGNQP